MLTEQRRKMLAKACGLCHHEVGYYESRPKTKCKHCGEAYPRNLSWDTGNDWELVRQKIVAPRVQYFVEYTIREFWADDNSLAVKPEEWLLLKTPAECILAVCEWMEEEKLCT